ncbi:DUF4234 domain-containing protein [Clostridium felsineum]|uniref:DUF4234 domain-containing protein n=1 Tax=Clostridium felsineum TaxID=36839 RepID=A0A1S8M827_9CLOT|nr:DUF4234 domain-containing protein [Clostridium felsineum]MCR3759444.1 DUF4234 domain-containing protein [Clostridium felsineum]URZ01642.1 hypothetical protein CLAUR_016370 [Clostridium felsineum]URZ05509.1 hypothetical protein CLROS_008350 [Clostridium felsineum]URZ10548.1 hypothetical protein CROST_012580 [Clostridium felsineum]URZ17535.1 hypothetical protein CLFE_035880 [Clostridium felsineum DSM 794]
MLDTNKSIWKYALLGIITCGIYSYYTIYKVSQDVNVICDGDGRNTAGLIQFILLSIVTCGIYAWFWYYGVGNRLQENAPRYNLTFAENGTTVLMWMIFGSLICGIGFFVGFNVILKNTNRLALAYNAKQAN